MKPVFLGKDEINTLLDIIEVFEKSGITINTEREHYEKVLIETIKEKLKANF